MSEKKFGKNTRFDFYLQNESSKTFIEVKNVTLSRKKGIAEFPDSVTDRGLKHLEGLLEAKKLGYKIYLIFVVQREKCKYFQIAKDIDPQYAKLLTVALKNKLKVISFDCKFYTKGIKLNKQINFQNE
mgnify:FL=1